MAPTVPVSVPRSGTLAELLPVRSPVDGPFFEPTTVALLPAVPEVWSFEPGSPEPFAPVEPVPADVCRQDTGELMLLPSK